MRMHKKELEDVVWLLLSGNSTHLPVKENSCAASTAVVLDDIHGKGIN